MEKSCLSLNAESMQRCTCCVLWTAMVFYGSSSPHTPTRSVTRSSMSEECEVEAKATNRCVDESSDACVSSHHLTPQHTPVVGFASEFVSSSAGFSSCVSLRSSERLLGSAHGLRRRHPFPSGGSSASSAGMASCSEATTKGSWRSTRRE